MTDQAPISSPRPEHRAVRWWLAIGSIVLGVLVLVSAGLIAHGQTDLRGAGASFWSSLFVNVGTTLLLAAGLIGLERVIVKKVREDRHAAVTEAAEIAADSAAQRTAEAIQSQLDDLDRRVRERASSRVEDAAEAAQRVADLGTHQSVRDALAEAADIDAIGKPRTRLDSWSTLGWEIIVPAGDAITAPRLHVTFYPAGPSGDGTVMFSVFGHRESSSVLWAPEKTPEEVFDELQEAMVRGGLAPMSQRMSAEALFRNLSEALRDALLSRRAAPGAWHGPGPVIEMISESCVMTAAGIEIRGLGLVVERSEFGLYHPSNPDIAYDTSIPPRPDSIDADLWDELIHRGTYHYQRPDPDAMPW